MKKHLLWMITLLLIACLLPAAQAMAEPSVPDFASFTDGRFSLVNETDYGFCALKTYEAPRTESEEEVLEALMLSYKEWFMDNSDMAMGGEHFAEHGRFGAYEQEASWFSFNESGSLSSFSMNLIDTQVESCHVMLAFKAYDDKYGLDMYISSGVELTEYVAESIVIPDFAAYAGSMILGTEEMSGLTVYKLPKAHYSDVLFAYSSLLEESYGFSTYGSGNVDGMSYVWFENHETIPAKSLADLGLEGDGCFVFAYANVEGDLCVVLYPDDGFIMEDTGERYQTDLMIPVAVDDGNEAAVLLPDFAAYAGDAILNAEDGIFSLNQQIGMDVLSAYSELLENEYGLSGLEEGIADDFLLMWYTECADPEAAGEMIYLELDNGMQAEGYFYFIIGESEEELLLNIQCADGMTMADTGERYVPDTMIPVPAAGEDSQEKLTIPSLESFMSDAVKDTQQIDGVTYYRIAPENVLLFAQYGDMLSSYGIYGAEETDDEDGFPFYAWFEDCEQDLEPEEAVLHGRSVSYYLLATINVEDGDFLISVDYADCLNPVDTGERWDGVSIPSDELLDAGWYVSAALASAPGQEPQEKVTVPMLEAFMNEAVKETHEVDGVTHYRVAPENASALIQYFALMEDYGVYQLDESEEEYGLPMYLWLEDCDHDVEPKRGSLHGYSTDYYVLVGIDVDGSDFLISVDYADCFDPIDTGDRWDGASLTPDEIPDEWPFNVALASEPVLPELSAAPGRVLVSEPADASQFAHTYSPDAAFMQDMVTYCAGRLSYEEIDDSANYMVRNYKGSKSDYQLVKDYVDMLVETNPYLELQHFHEKTYDDTFYSFAIDYTGNVNLGPQTEQTFTDNMCDIMLYGTIERDRLELSVWTPANMELVDLGMRWGGEQADVSIGGESALAGLYRNADGTFETTDGRFWVAPGEAMVLRDGFAYTTEATFDRDDDGNRDRIWMRYFYRDETLHLSYPTRSLMAGDVFRLSDFNQESSWLVRDRGILDDEKSLTSYRWDGLFLGVNHDGDWMTPVNAPTSSFSDATVRVMYMDKEVAVFYIYAEYTTSPLVMEALCAVPLTDELTEDEIDYTTYVGQSINVSYEWTEFGASYELFDWEIISGGDLASLSNTESKTCTLTANKPGLVGLRVSYNYGAKEPDVLTGNPRSVSRTKTQDYTIMIK